MMSLHELPNQAPNERVELFLRRHWFAWGKIIAAFVILAGIPLATVIVLWERIQPWLTHPVGGAILIMAASIYTLGVWLLAFLEFTDYYLDVWIVSNERVINIEQNGLFNRVVSEMHLANIQDVTSEVKGMIRTFFDYGNVHVQTSAEKVRFEFKNVSEPEVVKEKILRLVNEDKGRHGDGMPVQQKNPA